MHTALHISSWISLLASAWICTGDKDVSGGFGDLEISPTQLTRVDYRGIHLPVWQHRGNSERQSGQKQYFTLPLVNIGPNSATCIHNVLTDSISLHLKVIMWSDEVETVMISKIRSFTNIERLDANQISIIPMERIRFVWKSNPVAQSDRFLLNDAWQSYALKTRIVRASINADTMASCEKLRDNINSQPEVLNDLELQFILKAKKTFQKKMRVNGEHFRKSLLLAQMQNLAGSSGWILLSPKDLNAVSQEVVSHLVAQRETDAGYIDSGDQLSLAKRLDKALESDLVSSGEISIGDWSRVYWKPLATRPDRITATLNKVFKKSGKESTGIVINISQYEEMMNGLPGVTHILRTPHVTNSSIIDGDRLIKWLLENNIKSQWNGNKCTIKPMKLYRIYVSKLIARQNIVVTDVQVHSNEHVYSLKPTISDVQKAEKATASISISALNYKVAALDKRLSNLIDEESASKKMQIKEKLDRISSKLSEYDTKFGILQTGLDAVTKDLSDPLRKLRENDRIAQAVCTTMGDRWIYAVRRDCVGDPAIKSIDCNAWCKRRPFSDQMKSKMFRCIGSLHVHPSSNTIPRNSTALQKGDKGVYLVYNYKTCATGCGPNYCCCIAADAV